jgi:hypothetical protein
VALIFPDPKREGIDTRLQLGDIDRLIKTASGLLWVSRRKGREDVHSFDIGEERQLE